MSYSTENIWYGLEKWEILKVRESGDEPWEHNKGPRSRVAQFWKEMSWKKFIQVAVDQKDECEWAHTVGPREDGEEGTIMIWMFKTASKL